MEIRGLQGRVARGFENVRNAFERNLAEHREIGAAVAAYWHGEKVVDLWGGSRTLDGEASWNEDTMVCITSATTGISAMTLAVAHARGWLDYDEMVAAYWPEFAQNGKEAITVRQLLDHEAGLVLACEHLSTPRMRDLDEVAALLAQQKPLWTPGTRHGFHLMSLGLYMQELIRRVDPARRTLGRFFAEEIARPLHLTLYIGVPAEIPNDRIAQVKPLGRFRALMGLRHAPVGFVRRTVQPHSLLRRAYLFDHLDWNDPGLYGIELPTANGVGTARALARAYSAFANGANELGIASRTLAQLVAPPRDWITKDEVLGIPTSYTLGFSRPGPGFLFGSSNHAFGAGGVGGSFAFADPDAHLAFAYVTNRHDVYAVDDPREKALRNAIYGAVRSATPLPAHAA
jgi:CubicO group peptidase (beta-lactamase class C family)